MTLSTVQLLLSVSALSIVHSFKNQINHFLQVSLDSIATAIQFIISLRYYFLFIRLSWYIYLFVCNREKYNEPLIVSQYPIVTYRCESQTIKKAECQRIDAFELWCWRRLLRVPWTARRSNQPILEEISPEYSLEGLMLKLKLQYFGHLVRTDSFKKTLMLGKIEGRREKGMTEDEMIGWHP